MSKSHPIIHIVVHVVSIPSVRVGGSGKARLARHWREKLPGADFSGW